MRGSMLGSRRHVLLCMACCASCHATLPEVETPPMQTEVQRKTWRAIAASAREASEDATPSVLRLFDQPDFRVALQECCPSLATWSSMELLQRFREEVDVAEVAHSMPVTYSFFDDTTMELVEKYDWFLNQYQARLVQNRTGSSGSQHEVMWEEVLFRASPFERWPPSWSQATDRLIYTVQNLRQYDFGSNDVFGTVAFVFSPAQVREMTVIAPVDTGLWMFGCEQLTGGSGPPGPPPKPGPKPPQPRLPSTNYTCSAWRPTTLGVPGYIDHLILPHLASFEPQTSRSMAQEAANLFKRMAMTNPYADVPALSQADALHYFEANLYGNPHFPTAVNFVILHFPSLFGTADGNYARRVAEQRSWPVAWAFGSGMNLATGERGTWDADHTAPGNRRVLDPTASTTRQLNASFPEGAVEAFEALWSQVASARSAAGATGPSYEEVDKWWSALEPSTVRVAPLSAARACAAPSGVCVGTDVRSGDCVCRHASSVLMI